MTALAFAHGTVCANVCSACAAPASALATGAGVQTPATAASGHGTARTEVEESLPCNMQDQDNDGLPDELDHCPDEAGPVDAERRAPPGCPYLTVFIPRYDVRHFVAPLGFCPDEATPPPLTAA